MGDFTEACTLLGYPRRLPTPKADFYAFEVRCLEPAEVALLGSLTGSRLVSAFFFLSRSPCSRDPH